VTDARRADGLELLDGAERPAAPVPSKRLEAGILLALLYADLFDYPLTPAEVHEQLVGISATRAEADHALARLAEAGRVERAGAYLVLPGRAALVALREERRRCSAELWPQAERFARWMRRVPFVRLVAVCGSLARENAGDGADVDLFVITSPGRLWLAHVAAMLLRRALSPGGAELCPNHFLTTDSLTAQVHTLYTAHEVAQVVPLFGGDVHARFLAANLWTRAFLPQADAAARRGRLWERRAPAATRALERLLGGRLGEALDRAVHRVLLRYYTLRLRPLGIPTEAVARAYRRESQHVVTGGYAPAVAQRFRARAQERLGAELHAGELDALFPPPGGATDGVAAHELYARLLAESYGGPR
jgi:predicted nucleotidyltransferase